MISNNYKGNEVHFTSDLHVFHKNILKYSNRPFSTVEEMNKALINNWNSVVKPTDHVFHLGDFAFCRIGEIKNILLQLNGYKHFILGNHDQEIIDNKESLINEGFLDEIEYYKEITVDNQKIVLFHYGCRVWNKSHYGSWLLYGHSHSTLPPFNKSVDVGVDANFILNGKTEYRPYSFYEIKDFMKNRKMEAVDHHQIRKNNE